MTNGSDRNPDSRKPTDIFVGSRLRQARQRAGSSADDIAGQLGIPLATYADAEDGRWRLSATQLQTCAEVTGVDFSWFFVGMHAKLENSSAKQIDRSSSAEVIPFQRPKSGQ
ncbi:MAG: helix-turn-helix domain-containing protein [Hyphomicrobiaceae bacterium]